MRAVHSNFWRRWVAVPRTSFVDGEHFFFALSEDEKRFVKFQTRVFAHISYLTLQISTVRLVGVHLGLGFKLPIFSG